MAKEELPERGGTDRTSFRPHNKTNEREKLQTKSEDAEEPEKAVDCQSTVRYFV